MSKRNRLTAVLLSASTAFQRSLILVWRTVITISLGLPRRGVHPNSPKKLPKESMDESAGTTVHHLFLLCLQIACLFSLASPYMEAFRAGRWNEYIMDKSWGFGRFVGDFSAVVLFIFHLFTWAQPVPQLLFLFYGWTATLCLWAIYRSKQTKNINQKSEV